MSKLRLKRLMILPKNYRRRVFIGIILIILSILFLHWQSKEFQADLERGPDLYEEVSLPITYDLMDSVSAGLSKYHRYFGHYPNIGGKYFLDSIRQYLNISDVYVYADLINDGIDTTLETKKVGENFNYKNHNHTYIGIGTEKLILVYKRINSDSFKLYSVGKNLIDEKGKGDDVLFFPK